MWLEATCIERYGQSYLQGASGQRTEMLELIAFRKNAEKDPKLSPGIEFFSTLRNCTSDGLFHPSLSLARGLRLLDYPISSGSLEIQPSRACRRSCTAGMVSEF